MNDIPRRIRLDLMLPAEVAIYNAIQEVQKIEVDIRLTEAIIKLHEAIELVANYVNDVPFTDRKDWIDGKSRLPENGTTHWMIT